MPPQVVRDVRATLDIDVAKAQKGLRDLEKSGERAEKALKDQEDAARGYERQLEKTGSAASTMRRRLEAATRALPKITISADSSEADSKLANLRESLAGLSSQKIGIDISGTAALAEMRRVKAELEELARTEADPIIRADVQIALREINRVEAELDKLNADTAEVKVDVDNSKALAAVEEIGSKAGTLGSLFEQGLGTIGKAGPANVALAVVAIGSLPVAAQVAAAGIVAALGGALAGVGLAAAANADRVKVAWSDTASQLKRELGEVAAPLEDSAIRASGVAREAFAALKPILREVFADLGPDLDRFMDGLGELVARVGPSLKPLGDAFGELLSSIGDRAGDMGEDLGSAITTFAETTSKHADDIANLFAMITTSIKMTADGVSWLADQWDGFLTANELLHSSLLGVNKDYDGSQAGLARLNEAASAAITAAYGLGSATNESATAVRDLAAALDEFFNPAAKALDAEIRLKQALQEAAQAAKETKMSELDRLQSVQSLTKALADAATAEAERTGKTEQAGKAFMDNLGRLNEWAGSNQAARNTVAALGQSLGVTTIETNKGKFAIDAFGNAVKILPSGKTTRIDADTAKGKALIAELQRKLNDLRDKTVTLTVKVQQDGTVRLPGGVKASVYARGGIAEGGVRMMADGGVLPPMVTGKATYSGVSNAIFGEAGKEAFIPYGTQHRGRAVDILAQVADDFGFVLLNKLGSQALSGVEESVKWSSEQIGVAMGGALDTLDATLGQSGSLTGAIGQVGTVGESLVAGWTTGSGLIGDSVSEMGSLVSVSVTGMADTMAGSIDGLTGAVEYLSETVSATTEQTRGSTGHSAKETRGSLKGGGHSAKETRGSLGHSLKETRGALPAPKPVVWSNVGVGVGGGVDLSSTSSGALLQAATLRSVPAGGSLASTSSGGGSGGGSTVSIGSFHASPDQSPYQIAQDLDWLRRGG